MNVLLLLFGFFIGFGAHYLYTSLCKKKGVKTDSTLGDPRPIEDPKDDHQTI